MTTEAQASNEPTPAVTPPAPAAPAAPEPVVPVALSTEAAPAAKVDPAPEPAAKFEPTGDVGLDVAYAFLSKLGVKPDDPAVEAAKAGDFALIRAKLSAMGDKAAGWQEHVALAQDSYSRSAERATAAAKATADAVYGVVGGKDTWDKVQAWASATASDAEKAELNASFERGGLAAKAAAKYLHNLWVAKSGQAVHKPAASGNASAAAVSDSNPLNAKDYSKAVAELVKQYPGRDLNRVPEYAKLQQRRVAGKRAGL